MRTGIYILENEILEQYPDVLDILLRDHTTQRNIIWATNNYEHLGGANALSGYGSGKHPFLQLFLPIPDSTTSYESYSSGVPNEKMTWGKLDFDTPKFIVESDATIVVPLMFAWNLKQ